jgi:hypothetical protein
MLLAAGYGKQGEPDAVFSRQAEGGEWRAVQVSCGRWPRIGA